MRQILSLFAITVCLALSAPAQAPDDPETEDQLNAEYAQAESLYKASRPLEALPLYEDLHRRRPRQPIYMERLAMAYVAKSGAVTSPAERVAARNHARKLFLEARAAGDTSDLLQVMLEKLGTAEVPEAAAGALPPGDPRAPGTPFAQAELLFSKGDLAAAIPLYQQSWQQNPTLYLAPLFAGDAEYKLGHYDQAGTWFARAIAIDPNLETAHRYWGDCLMKAGHPAQARTQYIDAFLADPYSRAPRLALREWARAQHVTYLPPPITIPAPGVTGDSRNTTITLDPKATGDPLLPAWLAYAMSASLWHNQKFTQTYPQEKTYRHSLPEEAESLRAALAVAREQKIPDDKLTPALRSLIALEKDNMLECWILLDAPDQGTAQDYLAFRAAHPGLLRAYVEKYDLHPA